MENKKFFTAKTIFIILGVVVLVEVIWSAWVFFKAKNEAPAQVPTTQSQIPPVSQATISLTSSSPSPKVGERVTMTINVSTTAQTDGMDLILSFDPQKLSVVASPSGQPVAAGSIYNQYPQNNLEGGIITLSGITDKTSGVPTSGILGTIIFQAKQQGQTEVKVDFTPGNTADSNIVENGTAQDILTQVNNLKLEIQP